MRRSILRHAGRTACCAVAAASVCLAPSWASAGTTKHFPFEDARYLLADQHDGGTIYVPDGAQQAEGAVPIVVFLHGINPQGELHQWMDGAHDLRPIVDALVGGGVEPFVLAAPSQTRDAGRGRDLWPDFDVDEFVGQAANAVSRSVDIDARRVYLVGHSGAGCNTDGGLASAARTTRTRVRGVLAVDTCMDSDSGGAFARIPARVPVWVTWQPRTWPRDLDEFRDGLGPAATRVRIQRVDVTGRHPHDDIVPRAFRMMAHQWLIARGP